MRVLRPRVGERHDVGNGEHDDQGENEGGDEAQNLLLNKLRSVSLRLP